MVSFTDYMNQSIFLQTKVSNYLQKEKHDADSIRKHLKFIHDADIKSETNVDFRNNFYNWMTGNSSTIKLIKLADEINYSWDKLEDFNIICTLDAL